MNRTDRLYALVEVLRAANGRPVSATRLAERFEVTTRTIERDLSALQESGASIYAEAGRTGGYVLDATATLPPLNFTAMEATAVAVALARMSDNPLAADCRSALGKLMHAMPAEQARRAESLVERIRLIDRPAPAGDDPNAARLQRLLTEAVTRRVVATIAYTDRQGTISQRVVEPIGLLGGARGWYLLAWCRTRDDSRVFRLDRVSEVQLTTEDAPDRVIEDVFDEIPGMRVRAPELR